MRFLLLILLVVAIARAQLGAAPDMGMGGPRQRVQGGSRAGNHFNARRNEDSKWGSSFDLYKSARDAWKKDPKNADKKRRFDEAEGKFFTSSGMHRGNNRNFDSESEDSVCQSTDNDRSKHNEDKQRSDDHQKWASAYKTWSAARRASEQDPQNADKRRKFEAASKSFDGASRHERDASSKWSTGNGKWASSKGFDQNGDSEDGGSEDGPDSTTVPLSPREHK